MTLPASYDAWRTTAPEAPPLHPGPHRNELLIEAPDLSIDAYGWYDGNGNLLSVQIGKQHVKPENVARALALLGATCSTWADPLDADTLAGLSRAAFEYEAELEAEARGTW
jgi:hypothetical protein